MTISDQEDSSRRRSGRFSRIALLGLVVLLVLGAGGYFWSDLKAIWSTPQEVILKERLIARWQALALTKRTLDAAPVPGGWDGGVFLSSATLGKVIDELEGSRLEHDGDGLLNGTGVEVQSIDLKPSNGALEADIKLKAHKSDIALDLWLSAAIMVLGTEEGEDADGNPQTMAVIRIEPLAFAPFSKIGLFQIGIREFWGRLIPNLSVLFLNPELFQFRIPLKDKHVFDTAVDFSDKSEVNKDGSTVSYRVQVPSHKIEKYLAFTAPAYTSGGLWLFGRVDIARQPFMQVADRPDGTNAELTDKVTSLEKEIGDKLAALGTPESDARLYIGKNLFMKLADGIAEIPSEKRVVTITTTAAEGPLGKTDWSNKILGRGGASARLAGDATGGRTTIRIGEPKATWSDGELSLRMPLGIEATAPIHIHVDPLIGGGAGTDIGMEGSGSGTVTASGKFGLAGPAEAKVAVLDWNLSCEPIGVEVATDGRFKISLGWTKVPAIGAKVALSPKPKVIRPIALIDARPIPVRIPEPRLKNADNTPGPWILRPNKLAAVFRLKPTVSHSDADGFHIGATISVDAVPVPEGNAGAKDAAYEEAKRSLKAETERVKKATATTLDGLQREEKCPNKPEIAILLGNIEFGSNNEIVKFFRNAWSDLTNGPGPNNEFVKAYDALSKAVSDAKEVLDAPSQEAVKWMKERAGQAFGENSEAAKLFRAASGPLIPGVPVVNTGPIIPTSPEDVLRRTIIPPVIPPLPREIPLPGGIRIRRPF